MEPRDRLIVALDVENLEKARPLLDALCLHVKCFKVGLQLITEVGAPEAVKCVKSYGGEVFLDAKFHDIPNTVAGASKAVQLGVKMFNVHCQGGLAMMRAAYEATEAKWADLRKRGMEGDGPFQARRPLILGVTLLTSLNFNDLVELGVWDSYDLELVPVNRIAELKCVRVEALVASLAQKAKQERLDGVVCSPQEIRMVRSRCGDDFKIVTPGIRLTSDPPDDQKRTMTVIEAARAGADYFVVGRSITNAKNPTEAAMRMLDEIASVS